jgi:hypothetical protein
MMEPRRSRPEMEHKVLNSLFNMHETPVKHNNAPGCLDWRKIVKELHNDRDSELHSSTMPATRQKPHDGIFLERLYVSFKYIFFTLYLTEINIKCQVKEIAIMSLEQWLNRTGI